MAPKDRRDEFSISFATKTVPLFDNRFRTTRIAFKVDDGSTDVPSFDGSQDLAILKFIQGRLGLLPTNCKVIFLSSPNTFRSAFEQGWIRTWDEDGFETKPTAHRSDWKCLRQMQMERDIEIDVGSLPANTKRELVAAIKKKDGNVYETPGKRKRRSSHWRVEESPEEMTDRAIRRDKR